MASNISLGYHNLMETERHNRATEHENIRANNLLDTRTRDIADKDRISRERVASEDRTSRADIATADRASREFINAMTLLNELEKLDKQISANRQLQQEKYGFESQLLDARLANELEKLRKSAYYSSDNTQIMGALADDLRSKGETNLANIVDVVRLFSSGTDSVLDKANVASSSINNLARAFDSVTNLPTKVYGNLNSLLSGVGSVVRGIGSIIPG